MKVEGWIDAQIIKLFNGDENNGVEIDLDIIQDLETISEKRKFAFDNLQRGFCPASMDKITVFLDELIDQLNVL
uniref:Lipoate--protein ligase n=1 Tax=Heterorhabditis bacteriophora TaxID=37862 RepID=A0A1I7XK24_HETBA